MKLTTSETRRKREKRATPADDPQSDLKPHQLEVFCAVARRLSYVQAAQDLYLSQPAVSQQIKALEATLGVRLFERSGRGVRLSAAGEKLQPSAERLLGLLRETAPVVNDIQQLRRGSVLVGASASAGAYVVPQLLGSFHADYPHIQIALKVANRFKIEEALLAQKVDLAVMGLITHPEHFTLDFLMPNKLIMVAAAGHRLADRKRIALEDLSEETLLLREPGSGTRLDTERLFEQAGAPLPAGMELGDTGAIREAVGAGLGIAVVFRESVAREIAAGELVELAVEGFPLERRWYVAHVRDRRLSLAASALRDHLLRQVHSGA